MDSDKYQIQTGAMKSPRQKVYLSNVTISGGRSGIRLGSNVDLVTDNVRFHDVGTPIDASPGASLRLKGTRVFNDPKLRGSEGEEGARTGWRNLGGAPLPIFCPDCKTISPSRNYRFSGLYFNNWDNREECPACGSADAKLSEGVFEIAKDTVRIISAPDITYALLRALGDISERVSSGVLSPDQAASEIEPHNPRLANFMRRHIRKAPAVGAFIAAIIGIYVGLCSVQAANRANALQEANNEIALEALEFDKRQAEKEATEHVASQKEDDRVTEILFALVETQIRNDGIYQNVKSKDGRGNP